MATETLSKLYTESLNIYFAIWNKAGQVLDFADGTFKALSAPPTTPYVAATERGDVGGTGKSLYVADIDLDDVNRGAAVTQATAIAYQRAGGSPNLSTDSAISEPVDFAVQFGRLGAQDVVVQSQVSVKSTEGAVAQISAWLEVAGEKVDPLDIDASATCSVTVREHGEGTDLFTEAGDATDVENGRFEYEKNIPNFTDDRQYEVEASITMNGVTVSGTSNVVVIG
mgnify:CR=1 FL=1